VIDEYGALMEIIISKGKRKKLVETPAAVPPFPLRISQHSAGIEL
jgi:hypothetical protein